MPLDAGPVGDDQFVKVPREWLLERVSRELSMNERQPYVGASVVRHHEAKSE